MIRQTTLRIFYCLQPSVVTNRNTNYDFKIKQCVQCTCVNTSGEAVNTFLCIRKEGNLLFLSLPPEITSSTNTMNLIIIYTACSSHPWFESWHTCVHTHTRSSHQGPCANHPNTAASTGHSSTWIPGGGQSKTAQGSDCVCSVHKASYSNFSYFQDTLLKPRGEPDSRLGKKGQLEVVERESSI